MSPSETVPRAPMKMAPVFSPRPWGGTRLRDRLGKDAPADQPVGESWELSDHPNGRSRIAGGAFDGRLFGDVLRAHPRAMIARDACPDRYPLLVKIIDAAHDLSIQVHPDDAAARAHGDRGKTECWYVMDCDPGTGIIYGLQSGVTRESLRAGAADGTIESMVARFPLRPGDFLFVPAGTVHAILGGTMICEIQQSSDTTYRLWDWKREPARELHVEQSIRVIDWSGTGRAPQPTPPMGSLAGPIVLTSNPFFTVTMLDVTAGGRTPLAGTNAHGLIVVAVGGAGRLTADEGGVSLVAGDTAFVPACCGADVQAESDAGLRVLVAESRELASI